MSSNINPNNIDATYPIAGQDNDSQGFRDNFTNIKTNFQYAEDEINDLQSKAILKSALSGTTLDNDLDGAILKNGVVQGFGATTVALGLATGSVAVAFVNAPVYTLTLDNNVSLDINWGTVLTSGDYAELTIIVTVTSTSIAGGYTLTFPAAVSLNTAGVQGFNTSTGVMTFAAPGIYTFKLSTLNLGSTMTLDEVNKELQPLNASFEDLANGNAVDLSVTTSYFTTAGAETATLAAGVNGQVKTFAMYSDSGDMVITVTNAGWKSAGTGTITFNTIGQACTLQYINSKWFCIGNNGAVFA